MNLEQKIEEMRDEIIKSTQEIIKLKSVKDAPKEGMPFGKDIHQCFMHALDLSQKLGFKTKNIDNYGGHAEFGDGEEVVGILVHLDVVPEGDNWTYPPYAGEIHDGKIFGRGTIDDKGPAIAGLYAMKAIKESGAKLSKKIRIIFGLDEESGWESLKYYLSKEKAPNIAFTPDAEFPAIHGEKGILVFDLVKEFNSKYTDNGIKVLKIKGGNRPNMVPDYCEAYVVSKNSLKRNLEAYVKENKVKLEIEENGDKTIIKSYGVSAHGSLPEKGQNAISQLILFLNSLDLAEGDISDFIKVYCEKIGMDFYGKSIGCGFTDEPSGNLIFNVGIIDLNENSVKTTINIRYPVTYTHRQVCEGMKKALENTSVRIVVTENMDPIYLPKDHEVIQKLMEVYREFTGDDSEPITIGGGTYARSMENAVAFGPLFPGQPELAHQKDEFIAVEDLIKITKIYAKALYELAK
ncbi:dipeptidase PepV [Paramaledivibacter caminithermalis]|uniref:Succinyl-diaminopimelate desuccinylase n=1 Tax=Paramaledivibacter caminithermalis (strain DSM 15212 / CIP 107654 / DViRD3) TaxID=1121301 RepID=A0A1M6P9S0_PARC5|nr:dipeptidase PepV [Paramaledivibacter caminithermalis]SHK04721.1 succinyl-diaminopimelate desuccinylase [Paramaledivibacter caminithermalis DSM 15212]